MPFVAVVLGASAIDARTKELVIVRTSALLECRYCVQTHCRGRAGLERDSAREVRALLGSAPAAEAFETASERALLAWVDAVAAGRGSVAPELGAALREHFSESETVELTLLCAATLMLNRYCTALELPASPGHAAAPRRGGPGVSAVAEAIAEGRISARLWIYANYHCNLRCTYCLTESAPGVPRRHARPGGDGRARPRGARARLHGARRDRRRAVPARLGCPS